MVERTITWIDWYSSRVLSYEGPDASTYREWSSTIREIKRLEEREFSSLITPANINFSTASNNYFDRVSIKAQWRVEYLYILQR